MGPYLDPETGDLILDPDYTAQCLSDKYSSDMKEFFNVDSSKTTGPIFADFDFTEDDMEYAWSELSSTSAPGPDGIPAALIKIDHLEKGETVDVI